MGTVVIVISLEISCEDDVAEIGLVIFVLFISFVGLVVVTLLGSKVGGMDEIMLELQLGRGLLGVKDKAFDGTTDSRSLGINVDEMDG